MNAIVNFYREVRAEFKNISWPKKDTLIQLSVVVISISIIISLILGGFDYLFTQGLNLIGPKSSSNQVNTEVFPTVVPTIIQTVTPVKTK